MAVTLIAAVTTDDPPQIAATGNTYGTLAEAIAYLENRYGGGCFSVESEEQKQLALAAMRVLNSKRFIGVRATTDQPNEFPRISETIGSCWTVVDYNTLASTYDLYTARGERITSRQIPTRLKNAQFEIMYQLHKDAEAERSNWVAVSKRTGKSFETRYERKGPGHLSVEALEWLAPLLLSSLGAMR